MYALFFALYALKIQTCAYHAVRSKNQRYTNSFRFYVYSDKKRIHLKLPQNDNFSAIFVWLLCLQSKSSYNINAAFDRPILHIMQYIYVASVYHIHVLRSVPRSDKLFTKGLFMKFDGSVSLIY